jgi:hypothetical protein
MTGRFRVAVGLTWFTAGCTPAREGAVFPGHPMLTTYTKEIALEGSVALLGDGNTATAVGAAVSAFYRPWLSFLGGATFSVGKRKHYDTRAMVRLVYPSPLFGRLFPYASAGVTVFFPETEPHSNEYERHLGPVFGGGAFVQISRQTRVRLEVRDAWLPDGRSLEHNGFMTLSLVYQAR